MLFADDARRIQNDRFHSENIEWCERVVEPMIRAAIKDGLPQVTIDAPNEAAHGCLVHFGYQVTTIPNQDTVGSSLMIRW